MRIKFILSKRFMTTFGEGYTQREIHIYISESRWVVLNNKEGRTSSRGFGLISR
jgi:hypothetical protein